MDQPPSCSGSSSNSTSTSSLAHLPAELLVRVLRKLSPRQRFGGCALTCRSLLAAAVAATEELQLSNINQQRADGIALWLSKNSSEHLLRLELQGMWQRSPVTVTVRYDRLSHLRALTLCGVTLQTCSASSFSISSFSSSSNISSCSQLSLLSGLQRLELTCLPQPTRSSVMGGGASVAAAEEAAEVAYSAVLGTALGQLVQLTMLSLSTNAFWRLPGLALALASSLSKLQRLTLWSVGTDEHPVQLQHLPGSLTALSLSDASLCSSQGLSSSCQLSQLRKLELSSTDMLPTVLLHMSRLQTLSLHASVEKQAVLPVLPQLRDLRSVSLDYVRGAAAPPDYAALTANSQLEELKLCLCGVAASAAQHMFAAGRLLPHLRSITIQGVCDNPWCPSDSDDEVDSDEEGDDCALVLGPGGAARLAACCPGLQALGTLVVEADVTAADLLPLLQLSALTRLELGGHGCGDDVAQQVLTKMAGLVHLEVLYCPSLTPSGCAHLTSLTALTCLRLQHCRTFALDDGVSSDEDSNGPLSVVTFQSKVTPPDVWSRLQQICLRDPAALAVMYQHAQQRLAAQEQRLAAQEQQLQEQGRQLQQARQQIQELSQPA